MWQQVSAPRADLLGPALGVAEDAVYLHAGRHSSSGQLSDQLWRYGLATGMWDQLSASGTVPSARSGHTMVALRGGLVIVGGYVALGEPSRGQAMKSGGALLPAAVGEGEGETLSTDGVWIARLSSTPAGAIVRWERHDAPAPLARVEHCAATVEGSAQMYVYGGSSTAGLDGALWMFDAVGHTARRADGVALGAHGWSQLGGGADDDGGLRPPPRRGHSCGVAGGRLFVLGGSNSGADWLDDFWEYDLGSRMWQVLPKLGAGPQLGPQPPIVVHAGAVGSTWGVVRMECGNSSGGAAMFGARGEWQWLSLRPHSHSATATLLAHPNCPPELMWPRAVAQPQTRGLPQRAWLIGNRDGGGALEVWSVGPLSGCVVGCAHGSCDAGSGTCTCDEGWGGDDCAVPLCGRDCGPHGICDTSRRQCVCRFPWTGAACDVHGCAPECAAPRGVCDTSTGRCKCLGRWRGGRVPDLRLPRLQRARPVRQPHGMLRVRAWFPGLQLRGGGRWQVAADLSTTVGSAHR